MNRQAKLKTLSGAMLLLCAVITVTQLPSNIRYLRFACSPAGSGISVPQAVSELICRIVRSRLCRYRLCTNKKAL
ncbi:MAG: hypothetical protein L6V89_05790 [Oscillospiraceae bacterium]|nr:MAG: hypothetical protein L6V89_05790 [Oscillospiraceae bacterium]